MIMKKSIGHLLAGILLAVLWMKPASGFDRAYTIGDKIDASSLVVYAEAAEVRELTAGKKNRGGEELAGDYLYRLKVLKVLKGDTRLSEVVVVQSPEFRAEPRYFTGGQRTVAFLNNAKLTAKFRSKYRLPAKVYYECFANKQGVVAVTDSIGDLYINGIQRYLSAKRAKKAKRAGAWASLLEDTPDELKENALLELSGAPYYPAVDVFIRLLGEESLTWLAYKNLAQMPADSLEPRLDALMKLQKSDSRLVKVNLIKLVSPIHDDQVFKLLQRSLKDDKFEVRATAAKSLEGWTDKKAVKSLKKALNDDDDYVRQAAAEALAKQGFAIEEREGRRYRITSEPANQR